MNSALKVYLTGLILVLVVSLIVGAQNIKQYSFFGSPLISNCPYGGEIGPNDTLINERHICPPNGGGINWIGIGAASGALLIVYSIFYGFIYGIRKLYKKAKS